MDNVNESQQKIQPRKSMPVGINHVVLNVRDLEESHRFYTEVVGLKQVGELHAKPGRPNPPRMRFYSADHGEGQLTHHDLALIENTALPPPGGVSAVAHVAFGYADRETWQAQLAHVQAQGIPFDRRIDHGVTHSLYIRDPNGHGVELLYELPRDMWEGDINGAINYLRTLPTEGEAALQDNLADAPVFPLKPV